MTIVEYGVPGIPYDELEKLGVQVLSLSTDSRSTHKMWQEEQLAKMVPGGMQCPMLSDAGGRIGQVYGVYNEAAGVDVRGRFLIDPDGVIQAMEVLPPEVGRSVGEVTPAGWEPGKPTLTPGPDLVGKVWEVWKPETAE